MPRRRTLQDLELKYSVIEHFMSLVQGIFDYRSIEDFLPAPYPDISVPNILNLFQNNDLTQNVNMTVLYERFVQPEYVS